MNLIQNINKNYNSISFILNNTTLYSGLPETLLDQY